jgi:hypothetical protein
MGYHLEVEDQEVVFNNLSTDPIIINDIDLTTLEAKERFNELVSTHYDGDTLSNRPSCTCGELTGQFRIGTRCPICLSEVRHHTERDIESKVWIRVPDGVHAFINPSCWNIMYQALDHSGCNLLEWLTNPSAKIQNQNLTQLNKLKAYGFPRGLNAFYENFDNIIEALLTIKKAVKGKKADFAKFVTMYRERIFCKYVQIPSRISFVTEQTSTVAYTDPVNSLALDAIRTISSIRSSIMPITQRKVESISVKMIKQLAKYHEEVYGLVLGKKKGWMRKHVYGSRIHFSFRAVITPITEQHEPDELHLSWGVAVSLLKVHLTSKLMKRGYTPGEAYKHIIQHMNRYSSLLDELFTELMNESPTGALNTIFQRNPSLRRGSAQCFRVTKIKKDPTDTTVSMSNNAITAPNAD